MAFNGSGTFTRVHDWTTDLTNTVPVTASRMDAEDDGFATGLTSCIVKDGQQTCTARIPFAQGIGVSDGSEATPAINFTADTNSGVWRIGSDNIGVGVNGAKVLDVATTGLTITGTLSSSGALTTTAGGHTITAGGLTLSADTVIVPTGTAGAPTYSFASDSNTGIYRIGANNVGVTVGGTKEIDVAATGTTFTNAVTVGGTLGVTGAATFTAAISAATVAGAMVATQAQQETGSATNLVVCPGRQHFHQSAAKAWGVVTYSGGTPTLAAGYNIGSITDEGVGDLTLTFTTALSSANYAVVATSEGSGSANFVNTQSKSTTAVRVKNWSTAPAGVDPTSISVVVFGDI